MCPNLVSKPHGESKPRRGLAVTPRLRACPAPATCPPPMWTLRTMAPLLRMRWLPRRRACPHSCQKRPLAVASLLPILERAIVPLRSTLVACTPAVVLTSLALTDCALAAAVVMMFLTSCAPAMPRLLLLVTLAVVPTVLFLTTAPAPLNLHLRLTRTYLLECPFALAVSLRTVA